MGAARRAALLLKLGDVTARNDSPVRLPCVERARRFSR